MKNRNNLANGILIISTIILFLSIHLRATVPQESVEPAENINYISYLPIDDYENISNAVFIIIRDNNAHFIYSNVHDNDGLYEIAFDNNYYTNEQVNTIYSQIINAWYAKNYNDINIVLRIVNIYNSEIVLTEIEK